MESSNNSTSVCEKIRTSTSIPAITHLPVKFTRIQNRNAIEQRSFLHSVTFTHVLHLFKNSLSHEALERIILFDLRRRSVTVRF